jgi:hypothetical protein
MRVGIAKWISEQGSLSVESARATVKYETSPVSETKELIYTPRDKVFTANRGLARNLSICQAVFDKRISSVDWACSPMEALAADTEKFSKLPRFQTRRD